MATMLDTILALARDPIFSRPVATRLDCGEEVRRWLNGLPPGPPAGSLFGVKVYVDPTMAPDEWKMLDREGNVLARSTDTRGRP